ncbi:prohead protease/major capsid protein fusion protein [Methylocella sp.]|uniref:prohead protease/major capsid protein fusion protein n=1 Tax=Methylocella sp. TaxID=1978226 RepID=UPI0037845529
MTYPMQTRRAPGAPSSWNAEARTCDVIFATPSPVARRDARGPFDEVLDLAGLTPRSPALPVLDAHNRGSLVAQLGTATNFRIENGAAVATVTLSAANPAAQRLADDLTAGQTFGVSCGYVVEAVREATVDGRRTITATKASLLEISLVPVAADPAAGIRSLPMPEIEPPADPAPSPAPVERGALNAEIRSLARASGLDAAFADAQIDAGATLEAARGAALDALIARSAAASGVRTQILAEHDAPEARARAMGEALYARINPAHVPSAPARQFTGMSLPDLARDSLRQRGAPTTGLSAATIVERALNTTSDFPLLLGDTVGRTLRQVYTAAVPGIDQAAAQRTAKDFRAQHRLMFSALQTLELVNESGEFTSGGMMEAQESYRLQTWGRIIGLTRQAMVNDDLGAFAGVTRQMGQSAARLKASMLAGLLASNPDMSDGKTLFHADHGNVTPALNLEDPYNIDVARRLMRRQTGLDGKPIAVTPKYLIVAPELETQAEQILASLTPRQVADVNPFSGKLTLIVDPYLTGLQWYLAADPAQIDGLEYAYLEGAEGPQVETQVGFDVDGVRFRVRLDFGCGFVDWRGWHRNG